MCRRVFSLLAFLPVLQIGYHLLTGLYTRKKKAAFQFMHYLNMTSALANDGSAHN